MKYIFNRLIFGRITSKNEIVSRAVSAFQQRVGPAREVLETTTLLAPLFWPTLYTSVVATD